MKIISFWSGPRNVSTALMYSFAQRPDTQVIDEPFYAHYLKTSGAVHPGMELVLAEMENDGNEVLKSIVKHAQSCPVLFLKNMAHHWVGLDYEHLKNFDHVFLIRDPREMLPSLIRQIPGPVLRDTGLKMQVDLFNYLVERNNNPVVIDSKELLKNPKDILQKVCNHLQIRFYDEMLSWEPGPKNYDGVWAKIWYQNVHKSVGFTPYYEKKDLLPRKILPLLNECMPLYEYLLNQAVKN